MDEYECKLITEKHMIRHLKMIIKFGSNLLKLGTANKL